MIYALVIYTKKRLIVPKTSMRIVHKILLNEVQISSINCNYKKWIDRKLVVKMWKKKPSGAEFFEAKKEFAEQQRKKHENYL